MPQASGSRRESMTDVEGHDCWDAPVEGILVSGMNAAGGAVADGR